MTQESLKEAIKRELPTWLREDPEFRAYILDLTRQSYADREETQDRFYELLNDLRRDREEQSRKWAEESRRWEEQSRHWARQDEKWAEQNEQQNKLWAEQNERWMEENKRWAEQNEQQNKLWAEQNERWAEQSKRWAGQDDLWAENNEKWAESGRRFDRVHEEIMAHAQKFDRSIGALGARWGTQSEKTFRDALAGILERNFGVQVIQVNDYDDEGIVFGRPEQIEIDVIVRNGLLLICELKSSIDKAGMYIFERKARFYEKRHQRQANRLVVISPMIDARAQKVADRLGIETYGDSSEVPA